MEDSVQQLTDIVNDVLDMAKIESGSAEAMQNALTCANCVKTSHVFDAAVQEKGIGLCVDLSG